MTEVKSNSYLNNVKNILWPIENNELKKFLPMAMMMFFILFNYSMLRSIKDGFVVTHIGPESISFLKTYVVLPFAILSMLIYAKLCNVLSQRQVFNSVTGFFAGYFALFAFVLFPNAEALHPDQNKILILSTNWPYLKWFIKIAGKWIYASFYTMSELWGSMMLSLLFWQFANQITKTQEAKRFYSMFGLLGNFGLILTGFVLGSAFSEESGKGPNTLGFVPVISLAILSALIIIGIYNWMHNNVLSDPTLYDANSKNAKKSKSKLSITESFKLIFSSKYLGLIAVLVLAYGVSINLVEGIWKAKVTLIYSTPQSYTAFMGTYQMWQGISSILFMIIGSNILRLVSWGTAAMLTPLMIMFTGVAFFSFIIFDNEIAFYLTGILSSTPIAMAVMIGMVQNVLSKATKYSLFDSTKEMAYIPLDDELKSKGKAAVDVVGGRLGKSGGGIIQSTFFIFFPSLSFAEATPYFGAIFFVIVIMWLYAVKALNKEYYSKLEDQSY